MLLTRRIGVALVCAGAIATTCLLLLTHSHAQARNPLTFAHLNKAAMRHLKRSTAVVLALAVATAVAAACASGSARRPSPVLRLTSVAPVVISGRHFTPRVKVRLVVNAGSTQSRNAVPNQHGAFTATFTTVIDRCTIWTVSATQRGHAAVVLRGAKPACPPAGAP